MGAVPEPGGNVGEVELVCPPLRAAVEVHAAPWLGDYAAGRLGSGLACEIGAHLLLCDVCFAALLAQELGLSGPAS
jgi:hypothetical protein